jgi:hypothetical protein
LGGSSIVKVATTPDSLSGGTAQLFRVNLRHDHMIRTGKLTPGERTGTCKWRPISGDGRDGQIRTADLSLRRRPLYPSELRPHRGAFSILNHFHVRRLPSIVFLSPGLVALDLIRGLFGFCPRSRSACWCDARARRRLTSSNGIKAIPLFLEAVAQILDFCIVAGFSFSTLSLLGVHYGESDAEYDSEDRYREARKSKPANIAKPIDSLPHIITKLT